MVVPSPPFFRGPGPRLEPQIEPLGKDALRRAALDARKAFVRTLSDGERTLAEQQLAEHLTSLCAEAKVVGGYAPMGSEISPQLAIEEARAIGRIVAFPAFDDPGKPFKFRAGDPLQAGPFGIMQPKRSAPVVEPDLILIPLIAIDASGTRLGRGKGHYDRALVRLKKSGARLIGVGWSMQRIADIIPADEWDIPLDAFASPGGVEIFHR
ncbi:5-formyltetrahydrofolate cyclo-ligase [Sphingomonas flavescens]|uniref:5-formyltetrahydrofolate cyclo-ligase n=1 Tax=Sphingomonas flavescens TaxID=3132797 RepID=UPI0028037DA6|nr:5-formyltetrahydrofolate cyclo-ligase [Sphingomonas limnosediminicola]